MAETLRLDRRLWLGGGDQVVEHGDGQIADLAFRHVDGRQARLHRRALRQVVEAYDRDVVGNGQAMFAQCPDEAIGDDVVGAEIAFRKLEAI